MIRFVLLGALLAGCGNKTSNEGLPPATDWNIDPGLGSGLVQPELRPDKDKANPHEGVPGAPEVGDDDPTAEQAPDQNFEPEAAGDEPAHIDISSDQPIDPAHRVRGTLKVAKAVAAQVKRDGVIYLMAKQPDAAGKPTGTAMAVDRLSFTGDGQAFELGGATGDVLVIARYDQDQDGMTAQPGDIVGMARVKVPADNVVIELSTIVQ